MADALAYHEMKVSTGGRLIVNFRFPDAIGGLARQNR